MKSHLSLISIKKNFKDPKFNFLILKYNYFFIFLNMEKSFLIEEFQSSVEIFDVIFCIQNMKTKDSIPFSYVNEQKFIQGEPIPLNLNIKMNFLEELKKFIKKDIWTLIITKEALFNRCSNMIGFSPIEKNSPNNLNNIVPKILQDFQEFSAQFPKAFIFLNMIYSKKKKT